MPKYAVYSETEFLFDIVAESPQAAMASDVQATRVELVADEPSHGKGDI